MGITFNHIIKLKIQSMSGPGTLNFGNTLNVAPESNSKAQGGSQIIGDFGQNFELARNRNIDPDVIDQSK